MKKMHIANPEYIQRMESLKERPLTRVEIDIPQYQPQHGVWPLFQDDYILDAQIEGENTAVITADKDGLISLARLLLTFAQDEVPAGAHIHLDDLTIEKGSCELIIGKI